MTSVPPVIAPQGTVAIRSEDVCRHYKMGETAIRAVDGVSLEVRSGEFVALLGSSGSGKSSMLNLIAGLDRPSSGSVIVQERDLAKLSREELAKYRLHVVGMVFQSFNLIASMTIVENVELPLRFAEVDRGKRDGLAREALERVGLRKRMDHRPSELSGGEQQRAALARALINQPKLLLADEPTGNLDSHTGTEIMDIVSGLNRDLGMTVVMVTHERALAERYAQRLIFLADGKLVDDRPNTPGPPPAGGGRP
jgi:ABC-type lipoprotein export system ATPase subunit